MNTKLKKIMLAGCFLSLPFYAQAQAPLKIPRAPHPPVIAEYIKGTPSFVGVEVNGFKQRQPSDGMPISQLTKAYLSYDDTHFYAVFVAKDDPKLVRARIAKRDDFEGDDFVILELDTFHDKRRAYTFFVNPYGVQFDAKRTEGLDMDSDFETQWQSDGQMTEDGYVSMMAIPFKSLRFQNADVQTWGYTLGRQISRNNEVAYSPELTERIAPVVPQFGTLQIPEKLQAGRNLQFDPFVYTGQSKTITRAPLLPTWRTESKTQVGFDAKWVLGDSTSLDLTVKPDFSEVDSDEPQSIVDKRYEVQMPEKRPFFLENSAYFQTAIPLFFSRRIAEPRGGVRVTGREGAWAYGALLIDD
ncbi:MAG: carbohydrate binding family 9 domain-containing protein, partial [Undibacterium sp.]|nr:carbohydrate binding family 9 domain-containing protein [Undibacterium sp.]